MSKPGSVVIVEDDFLTQMHFQDMAEEFGYEVCGATDNAEDAVELTRSSRPQAVLMDVRLRGEGDGVDAALRIHDAHPDLPVIFITASNEPETIERIRQDHPTALLIKPVSAERLKAALARVLGDG